jgi:hypothetical protein
VKRSTEVRFGIVDLPFHLDAILFEHIPCHESITIGDLQRLASGNADHVCIEPPGKIGSDMQKPFIGNAKIQVDHQGGVSH